MSYPVCPLCEEGLHDLLALVTDDFKCSCRCHAKQSAKVEDAEYLAVA